MKKGKSQDTEYENDGNEHELTPKERKERDERKIARLVGAKPLNALVDAQLAIEKLRINMLIRQTHLKLQGRNDPETDALLDQLLAIEAYVDDRVAALIQAHPAYVWFSRVKGIGDENIAKIIGLVDIEKARTISGLWKFAGYAPEVGEDGLLHGAKKTKGQKLEYNSKLRTTCFRLGTSLLKASLRQQCTKCNTIVGQGTINKETVDKNSGEITKAEGECPKCKNTTFRAIAETKFGAFYLAQKESYTQRALSQGKQIVPATQLPKDEKGKRHETDKLISEGHIHFMALRKMIKMFLACLWLSWREAAGLPVSEPYSSEKLGHVHIYKPEDFIDR